MAISINRKQWLTTVLTKVLLLTGVSALLAQGNATTNPPPNGPTPNGPTQSDLDGLNSRIRAVSEQYNTLQHQLRNTPPIGTIIMVAWDAALPDGYLLCDGTLYTKDKYPDLFTVLGKTWGGDGVTNFNVPELRGEFPRFLDKGRGIDIDNTQNSRKLNGFQDWATGIPHIHYITDQTGQHSHDGVTRKESNKHTHTITHNARMEGSGPNKAHQGDDIGLELVPSITAGDNIEDHTHDIDPDAGHTHSIVRGGDPETRPRNQALVGYIKF